VKIYSTCEIAKIFGIHPNTVRFYEQQSLITTPIRKSNGYRVFTDLHIFQIKLIRIALRTEVLQNGLRNQVVKIIKLCAKMEFSEAAIQTDIYIEMIESELRHAKNAVMAAENILRNDIPSEKILLKKNEAATYLNITADTLRNWDRNGLIDVKRKSNGYRVYDENDLRILSIIRTLRLANYSLSSILRLLSVMKNKTYRSSEIEYVLNTPFADEDIITACDKLVISLENTLSDACIIRKALVSKKNIVKKIKY
jgi:DNA-binding transcriptional MerR regulator